MALPVVMAYYAAAGAAAGGAATCVAAFKIFLDRANVEKVKDEREHHIEVMKNLLKQEIELEELRRQAREAGVDPDEVQRGCEALKSNEVSPDEVYSFLTTSRQSALRATST